MAQASEPDRPAPGRGGHLPLLAIVLFAIAVRATFFVGLVSGDPQDDGVYYGNAFRLYNEGPRYLERFRDLPADFLANPIDQFHVRPLITYPIAASFLVFGPGEMAAVVWAFAFSILSVIAVYALGARLRGHQVGLVAALLCAFYPLEVIHGTRILSDVQVGVFFSLGLWLLVAARRAVGYAVCGVLAAGAYLANGRGLVVLAALIIAASVLAYTRRVPWSAPLWILGGFGVIFGVEAAVYAARTGDALLSYHIQAGASRFKYLHEPVSSMALGPLDVRFTNGRPFELTRSALLLDHRPTRMFGAFFFLFLAAAGYGLWWRRNGLLIGLAVGLLLYLDFGPLRLELDAATRQVHYFMLFKQERFLLIASGPLLVLAADLVVTISRRHLAIAGVLVLALFGSSMQAITTTRSFYRQGLEDLRAATGYVLANPGRTFYGDQWAVEHVKIFSRYRAENLVVLDARAGPQSVAGGCVMLGGSRGIELLADYVASTLPPFAAEALHRQEPPPGWWLALEINGPIDALRSSNFQVYCGPGTNRF